MGEVYKKAVETIVWLGPEENDSDIVMEKFSAIGVEALRCGILELSHTKFDAKKWVAVCVGKKKIAMMKGPWKDCFERQLLVLHRQ